ncbi:LiaF transmembrane domain-containing protein [Brevibacillus ginsengisoli]|uniref:LiaF transmembrane domain-containing protein n=1 Tax=Brevibacillus ginsengisoli TaxID=363854 RepID=UPI003CEFB8D4
MGERSGKVFLGLSLLIVGVLLLVDQLGLVRHLFHLLIPGLIMIFGAKKVISDESAGKKFFGLFIFLFGFLMMIGKLHLLFSSLLAIGVIYFGFRLIRRDTHRTDEAVGYADRQWAKAVLKEDALDRWEREVDARNKV